MIETKQTLLYKSETCLKTVQCSRTTVSAPTSRPVRHNISQGTFVSRARLSANVLQTDTSHRISGCKIALVWSSYYLEHRSLYMYVLFTAVNATVKSTRPWNVYFTYKFVRIYICWRWFSISQTIFVGRPSRLNLPRPKPVRPKPVRPTPIRPKWIKLIH